MYIQMDDWMNRSGFIAQDQQNLTKGRRCKGGGEEERRNCEKPPGRFE